jgi:hypothetical protein
MVITIPGGGRMENNAYYMRQTHSSFSKPEQNKDSASVHVISLRHFRTSLMSCSKKANHCMIQEQYWPMVISTDPNSHSTGKPIGISGIHTEMMVLRLYLREPSDQPIELKLRVI